MSLSCSKHKALLLDCYSRICRAATWLRMHFPYLYKDPFSIALQHSM